MTLQRIFPVHSSLPLHSIAATRAIEAQAMRSLPTHSLMQRAGLAVARLACALNPHARVIWLACGSGNNGGDGLEAAMQLRLMGREPVVTWLGSLEKCPPDALASYERALDAGVIFSEQPPAHWDVAVDALLGIGASRLPDAPMQAWLTRMYEGTAPVLAVDVPSGFNADTGNYLTNTTKSIANYAINSAASGIFGSQKPLRATLSLLTLKPGLFTAHGRDVCGKIWFDDLEILASSERATAPVAMLSGADVLPPQERAHASHKGNFGDVAVIGGAVGMQGAALLAARAALHAGAGRVFLSLLGAQTLPFDLEQPELMLREISKLELGDKTVVCGCGAGEAVRDVLPQVLAQSPRLVLDADALNAIAQDFELQIQLKARAERGQRSIITPHPLEAARLLDCSTEQVQSDRLACAKQLAVRFACTVLLKGSGSIIATLGHLPQINPTGNAKLATAGTGDVLAGWCGALLHGQDSHSAAVQAAFLHGQAAQQPGQTERLVASQLLHNQ